MERKARAATFTGIYLVVVAAIIIVANIISFSTFKRFDMTADERFTLSKGSKRLVADGLKQELRVDAYVTRGLAKSDAFIQDLTALFREYENADCKDLLDEKGNPTCRDPEAKSKFVFRLIEPKTQEEKDAAKKECSGQQCLQEQILDEGSASGDTVTIGKGFMGFVINYGSEKEVIPFWPPNDTQGLEFFLTNKIREVRDRADKIETKVGIITGKDEIKLSENNLFGGSQPFNLQSLFKEYFPFYTFEDVDLQNGDAEINAELKGIIITQPTKDYTEKELRRIDEFLMRGDKKLVVYASAVNIKPSDASMKATLSTHGLEKLLDGYGVEMKKEAIMDFGGGLRLPAMNPTTGQQVWIMNPPITVLQDDDRFDDDETRLLDTKFPAFFRMRQVAFPFSSPLVLHKEKQPEATFKVVARTYPRSTVDATDGIPMKFSDKCAEKGPAEQRIVGVTVEGTLKSAFPGGDKMGIEAPAQSKAPSAILVISSSQFLANPFARAGNAPPMPPQLQMMGPMGGDPELQMFARPYFENYFRPLVMSFKNTLDWMSGDADLIAVSAKLLGEPTLSYNDVSKPEYVENESQEDQDKKAEEYRQQRVELQQRVQWTLIIGPALLFAALGFLRWRAKEASRDKISIA